jgi:glycosyltransferase involved in cell wall biosynthesis
MKIAIVYPSLRAVGGAENVVIRLAESLAQRGHVVFLFTKEYSEEVWGSRQGKRYTVHLLDFAKHRSTLKTNRAAGQALQRAIHETKDEFDIINPHSYPASLWVYYARQQKETFPPVLLYLHSLTRNFYEKIIDVHTRRLKGFRNLWNRYRPKKLLRSLRQILFNYRGLDKAAVLSCDRVLANSRYAAELASKIYGINVIPCPLGVSVANNTQQSNVAYADAKRESYTALTVARLEAQKNIESILKALKQLKDRRALPSEFSYVIAGSGPQLDRLKRRKHQLGLDDIVTFLGMVSHEEVWKLYANASFIVHLPLDEPLGLVPMEAALMRKPSIVSDHGGPAEIVVHGETGCHVDALDVEEIALKIEYLIKHPDVIRTMGTAAYERAAGSMMWDNFINDFEKYALQTADSIAVHGLSS